MGPLSSRAIDDAILLLLRNPDDLAKEPTQMADSTAENHRGDPVPGSQIR